MTLDRHTAVPEHTAVRVALWRALHALIDPKPHLVTDEIGAKLAGEENWRERPDMNPEFSKAMRASIAGRARFIEDLLEEKVKEGISQYVILGAGLDTFAVRRPDTASRLQIFEVDQPGPQAWKQRRFQDLGIPVPEYLHFVPVDFESGESWQNRLTEAGFDSKRPAVTVSTGVSMYLTKEANLALLKQLAGLASGSVFAMTFMLSIDLLPPEERSSMEFVMKKTMEAGTPFLSLFSPSEILELSKEAGFRTSMYVSGEDLYQRYFAGRPDGLRAGIAEAFLIATA